MPEYHKDPIVKQISWDDQWIGYDDVDTIAGKLAFANEQCLGGTMIWSVCFDSEAGSGDIPDRGGPGLTSNPGGTTIGSGMMFVDSNIWAQDKRKGTLRTALRSYPSTHTLPEPTTVSIPPLTTSFIVESTIKARDETRTTLITSRSTISLPLFTTKEIEVWALTIFATNTKAARFNAVQSVKPLSFTLTLPGSVILPPIAMPTESHPVPKKLPPFGSSSHIVTIQPQPTFSVKSLPKPAITFKSEKSFPVCQNNCGRHSCAIFGCGGGCKLFDCGKACGLFGCGAGCGLFGCGGRCDIFGCGGCGLSGCGPKCTNCGPSRSDTKPPGGNENLGDNDDDDKDDDNKKNEDDEDDNDVDDDDDDDDDNTNEVCKADKPFDSGSNGVSRPGKAASITRYTHFVRPTLIAEKPVKKPPKEDCLPLGSKMVSFQLVVHFYVQPAEFC